jgi:hypothetical protein
MEEAIPIRNGLFDDDIDSSDAYIDSDYDDEYKTRSRYVENITSRRLKKIYSKYKTIYSSRTVKELRNIAKKNGMTGYSRFQKAELVAALSSMMSGKKLVAPTMCTHTWTDVEIARYIYHQRKEYWRNWLKEINSVFKCANHTCVNHFCAKKHYLNWLEQINSHSFDES